MSLPSAQQRLPGCCAPVTLHVCSALELIGNLSVEFGPRLRQLLGATGVSGAELARRLGGKNRSVVSNWTSGKDRPDPETIVRIADIFGVDRLALLQEAGYLPGEPSERSLDPRRAALISIVRDHVPEEDLTALETMLAGYRLLRKFLPEDVAEKISVMYLASVFADKTDLINAPTEAA